MEKNQKTIFFALVGLAIAVLIASIYLVISTGRISKAAPFFVIAMMLLLVWNSTRKKSS
ncbi:MAG: hypothetical protein JNM09_14085 [Blastocatellia bacterium]|nr:hypothetical protein [Blastocatellia bacterium]